MNKDIKVFEGKISRKLTCLEWITKEGALREPRLDWEPRLDVGC